MSKHFDVKKSPRVQQAIKEAESELADNRRVVLRASGTEPVVRVMVEGRDAAQVERLTRHLADTIKSAAEAAA